MLVEIGFIFSRSGTLLHDISFFTGRLTQHLWKSGTKERLEQYSGVLTYILGNIFPRVQFQIARTVTFFVTEFAPEFCLAHFTAMLLL